MDGAEIAVRVLELPNAPPLVNDRLALALLGSDPRVCQLRDGRWALQATPGATPLLSDLAYAVVDVETTGSRAGIGDRVTEIAVVVVDGARGEIVLDTLVNPERPISAVVTRVTGITNGMVASAPTFDEILDDVRGALAGRVFVAHNARFDWSFLNAELKRARDLALASPRLCTVRLARRLVPGLPSYGLDSLTAYFGWENPARHRAGGDAHITARLLSRLLGLAQADGVRTLPELEALTRGRGRRKRSPSKKPGSQRRSLS